LPFLGRVLGEADYAPTYALLKGWSNYVCLSRLDMALGGQASLLDPKRLQELEGLAEWAAHTADGSLADLTTLPSSDASLQ
jgi:Rad3-related DNA helicase